MPISDIFPNTPGFVAQIQDGGLKITAPPQSLSQSVLLLGVATDGPLNTPIQISSLAQAEALFGATPAAQTYSQGSIVAKSLTRGMYEAFQAGCTDIRLCRVSGTSAYQSLTDSATAVNNVTLTAAYPGAKYDYLQVSVTASGSATPGNITITTLDGLTHIIDYGPNSTKGITYYGDLLNYINVVSGLNITASQGFGANPNAVVNLATLATSYFGGGVDGTVLTDAAYSTALNTAYALLENYPVNVVVPLGAYLQPTYALDQNNNPTIANNNKGDTVWFGQNLAQFCARLSVNTSSCFGVISIAPLQIPNFVNSVARGVQLQSTAYTFHYATGYTPGTGPYAGDANGTTGTYVDIGYLLNILVGPDPIVNNQVIGNYVMDGAATYAGEVVSLSPQVSTTNQVLGSVTALAYNFGASVIDALCGQRFTVFSQRGGTARVVADNTYSVVNGDCAKLSTLRITYAAMENVRAGTAGFIGQAANPANLNALGTAVGTALAGLKSNGALLDYSYTISASASDQINGNLRVTLVLVPALEIRKIFVTISLTPPASVSNSGAG